jgi:PleD family two-component response regulator
MKPQLLIVEDDLDLADMLNAYFREQGYEVIIAAWGEDAVRICSEMALDLVILDIGLPDIDGFEVCRRIRQNHRTANMAILFLTDRRERRDKLAGLELGVVDFITKPFDIQELRLRVRNQLQYARQTSQYHPVTNAADTSLTNRYLEDLVIGPAQWAILSLRIAGLDHYRERYGFHAADEVLRAITLMVNNVVRAEAGGRKNFIGHFTNQDFIIITDTSHLQTTREHIEERLQPSLIYFYPPDERLAIETLPPEDRLRLVVGVTKPNSDSSFGDLDSLKRAILKSRERMPIP